MKNIIKTGLLLFSVVLAISGCRKEDNPKIPKLTRFPTPLVLAVAGTDQSISATNPASFNAKFTVDMFFKNDVPAKSLDVVVIKNDNKANVKLIKAGITSFPTEVSISGAQLISLFGEPIVLGDKFDISVDVTDVNGVKYQAFPVTGNAYGSGVASQPGASTFVRYAAVCQYDPNQYQGNFIVEVDEWADYAAGDVIQLTKIDATHFSFNFLANNPQPIVVTVNPNTNAVTVAKQVYGSSYSAPSPWPFGNLSAQSVSSPENFVAPCQGIFSVILNHSGTIDFGDYKLVLRKQ